jgi:hypothetical protein
MLDLTRVIREGVCLEHLISLVKYQDADAVNVQLPLGHPVLQAAVRANDHLRRTVGITTR